MRRLKIITLLIIISIIIHSCDRPLYLNPNDPDWELLPQDWEPYDLNAVVMNNESIRLTWKHNCDFADRESMGISFEDGYVIEKAVNGGSYHLVATMQPNTLQYIDADCVENYNYTYRVKAFAGEHESIYSIPLTISFCEILLEGFENTVTDYRWELNEWYRTNNRQHSGIYSIRSENIGDNQSSSMELTVNCATGSVTFYVFPSCEARFDNLVFYVDDNAIGSYTYTGNWQKAELSVSPGVHRLKWSFVKDYSVSSYDDCVYLDDIEIE